MTLMNQKWNCFCFVFSSRRRHTRFSRDWSSDVCSSDLRPTWCARGTRGRDCRSGISTIAYEIEVIADCSHRLLQGVSLRLAAELRDGEVPTVTGAPWTAETLRDILLRPRNAGFMIHKSQILDGVAAPWEPIVSPEVYAAVHDLLTDPSRRSGPGAAPRC